MTFKAYVPFTVGNDFYRSGSRETIWGRTEANEFIM